MPESKKFDLTKIQLSSKLSPKEFAKKIRERMGTAKETSAPSIAALKVIRQRDLMSLSLTYTQKSRCA